MHYFLRAISLAISCAVICSSPFAEAGETRIRVGYFPTITHAQAVIGMASGFFQKELGDEAQIEPLIFNAGPSVIEALFAGELDLAYVGPNPALNGYIKSRGEALKIVAGATSGGAALVVREGAHITVPADFHKKKIASPQLGNTQDVALRAWLTRNGLVVGEKGGDVQVIPVRNPDQLTLFLAGQIDAAWTVEPWVSRLVMEGAGKIFLEEGSLWPGGEYATAQVIVSRKFLDKHPGLVKKWLRGHVRVTQWINNHRAESRAVIRKELKRLTGASIGTGILERSFDKLKITWDPIRSSLDTYCARAFEQGFLGDQRPNLSGICDLRLLNEVLKEEGLAGIHEDGDTGYQHTIEDVHGQ
jgi:NitT/TauT family transport system substrate-binding protein